MPRCCSQRKQAVAEREQDQRQAAPGAVPVPVSPSRFTLTPFQAFPFQAFCYAATRQGVMQKFATSNAGIL